MKLINDKVITYTCFLFFCQLFSLPGKMKLELIVYEKENGL